MTKKDYIVIAEVLKNSIMDPSLRAMVALDLADKFKETNERFDIDKFLKATHRNSGARWQYQGGLEVID